MVADVLIHHLMRLTLNFPEQIIGICGAPDDDDQDINIRRRQGRQVYGNLDSNSSSSNS